MAFRWVGGRCAQVSTLTLGLSVCVCVHYKWFFETVRPFTMVLRQNHPFPLYSGDSRSSCCSGSRMII
eukprot:SAG31_NODE_907_length_11081_cov_6.935731_5_plen_68_part_00